MENYPNTNPQQSNPNFNPNPQPVHQPSDISQNNQTPPSSDNLLDRSEMPDGGGSKWFGTLVFVVVVALILYYVGFWSWLGSSFFSAPVIEDEQTEEVVDQEGLEGVVDEVDNGDGSTLSTPEADVEVGKGRVSFVISAGIPGGAVLTSGDNDNLEIRRVSVYNSYKNDWVLIYEGIRPLDLKKLAATGEKHELIEVDLLAMDYNQVRLEFVDLFDVNGGENVRRERVADLGSISVVEGEDNEVNVWFNIKDEYRPEPVIVLSN
ncbi:MAG: hypothetical protein ABH822_01835 [Patescibacteria group bacterium]